MDFQGVTMSKGRGWWGESGRHSLARRGMKTTSKSFHLDPFTPTMNIDGEMVVRLHERPAGLSVRWASSLSSAAGPTPAGEYQFPLPDGLPSDNYVVLEEDDQYVFLAVLLDNGHASAKHRYLVARRDWEKATKSSGGKFF